MKKRLTLNGLFEIFFQLLMLVSLLLVVGSLATILSTIVVKGFPALNWDIILQIPHGGYYLGKGGGIANAIIGSLYLAGGGTLLSLCMALPIVAAINVYMVRGRWVAMARMMMDVIWGIPTIVFGAFGFMIMLALKMRASLLAGIIVLSIVELPIIVRTMDEFIRLIPADLPAAAYALGSTRLEVAMRVIRRQAMPGLVTAVLLGFGRAIGDAASVLFTAGYTDRIPTSLFSPAASLPLAVFFQLNTPFPEVQRRAYAAALVLTIIVLIISISARWLSNNLGKFVIR
jgi:phosphate transport system permease protein